MRARDADPPDPTAGGTRRSLSAAACEDQDSTENAKADAGLRLSPHPALRLSLFSG